jgi:hypothetical protein
MIDEHITKEFFELDHLPDKGIRYEISELQIKKIDRGVHDHFLTYHHKRLIYYC